MKEIEYKWQHLITCPYCGWKDQDTWECGMGDGDCDAIECGRCEKEFEVTCYVTRDFSSKPQEQGDE